MVIDASILPDVGYVLRIKGERLCIANVEIAVMVPIMLTISAFHTKGFYSLNETCF